MASFLPRAKDLLALEEDIQREFCASRKGPLVLRIGGIETVLHSWLIPLVEQLRRERKQPIEFELNVEMTHVLDKRLRQGSLDLIFSAYGNAGYLSVMARSKSIRTALGKAVKTKPRMACSVSSCQRMPNSRFTHSRHLMTLLGSSTLGPENR